MTLCEHCKGDIEFRLPVPESGCDHLYYPDNCATCRAKKPTDILLLKEELAKKDEAIKVLREGVINHCSRDMACTSPISHRVIDCGCGINSILIQVHEILGRE